MVSSYAFFKKIITSIDLILRNLKKIFEKLEKKEEKLSF
jgi:hypothetical protein